VTIRAAGILAVTKDGRALFVKRGPGSDFPDFWCVPGGRREGEESAEETAIREAQEEIGHTFKKTDLKMWTRSLRPQENSPLVTPPQGEEVDFTTFIAKDVEEFTPVLGPEGAPEHTGFAWCALSAPPEPLHPGVRIALRRFTMDDELQVAEAIRDGELVSPQEYGNIHLFAFRISGVGTAVRGEKKDKDGKVVQKAEVVYRKPEDYTSQEFLTRAQGLPVIIMHPEEAILNTKQFAERVVGAIMITYLKPDADGAMEPWGVARIYDHDAAVALCNMDLSTSPGVLLGKDVRTLTLAGGTEVIIEGKPSLLDHLAICERGVWDKGGDLKGVDNIHTRTDEDNMKIELKRIAGETDENYAGRVKEAEGLLARLDSVANHDEKKLDKLLEGITGLSDVVKQLKARVDSAEEEKKKMDAEEAEKKKADAKKRADAFKFSKRDAEEKEEDFKKKMDAEEKACMDALMESGEPEEMAADAAKKRRKDAEDEDDKAKKADAEKAEEEKKKMDAKKDAETIAGLRDAVAALETQIKGALSNVKDEDRSKLLQAQARFDSVETAFGRQARAPLLGETLHAYRLDNLRALQKHSPAWKDKDIGIMAVNDSILDEVEKQILADAILAARNPTDIPKGQLVGRERKDGAIIITEYYGETAAWMRPLAGPVGFRAKTWVNPSPGARR
jgi:8-oxo-dGTP pyrophosphatase MutT (NUDIX family)